jgi:hypothetical protein
MSFFGIKALQLWQDVDPLVQSWDPNVPDLKNFTLEPFKMSGFATWLRYMGK